MPRLVFVLAYLGLISSLFTGVYHPFTVGEDRSWLIIVVFAAAHLALGASWRSNWEFALPPLIAIAGVLAASNAHNPWVVITVIVAVLAALVLIGIGRLLAWSARRAPVADLATWLLPGLLLLVAAAPLVGAARESYHLATGQQLPAADAQRLPLAENTLNSLCYTALPARYRTELNAQARAVVNETRLHADWVVHATYFGEDENAGEHTDVMTVRELAENQLGSLREFPTCEPALQHALDKAIG